MLKRLVKQARIIKDQHIIVRTMQITPVFPLVKPELENAHTDVIASKNIIVLIGIRLNRNHASSHFKSKSEQYLK